MAAAIWRPRPMPPGGEDGDVGTDGVDHLGHQHHRRDLAAVCPPASVPWAMITSTPRVPGSSGRGGAAAECADEDALGVRGLDGVVGRRAERVDQHRDRVTQRHLDLARALGFDAEAGRLHHALGAFGQRRDVVLGQQLLDELPVLGRDQRLEGVEVERPRPCPRTSRASRSRRRRACRPRARRSR